MNIMSKTTNYESNSIFPNTAWYSSKYMVLWVELCPPKKVCCDYNPQAFRTVPYSKIVVTHIISWDEVILEQGRPLFWFDCCLYKRRRDTRKRTPQTHQENAMWWQRLQLQAKQCWRLTATSRCNKQARNDSTQCIRALQLPWFLTSPELLRELSVLLSHPKYWYLDHGIKPRMLRVKSCVITGESK